MILYCLIQEAKVQQMVPKKQKNQVKNTKRKSTNQNQKTKKTKVKRKKLEILVQAAQLTGAQEIEV